MNYANYNLIIYSTLAIIGSGLSYTYSNVYIEDHRHRLRLEQIKQKSNCRIQIDNQKADGRMKIIQYRYDLYNGKPSDLGIPPTN